ncbi:MAG: hypothetical protein H8K05_22105, partial [Nitrospira sp.]|nr:hypothetical protein [Nitrospira sp.]
MFPFMSLTGGGEAGAPRPPHPAFDRLQAINRAGRLAPLWPERTVFGRGAILGVEPI